MSPFSLLANKYVLSALAFVLVASWGYYERLQHHRWRDKYETREIELRAAAQAAEARAKEVAAAQDKANAQVRAAAKRDRDRLIAYYERLRLDAAAGAMSTPAVDPSRVDVAALEQVAGGQDFERACALDAERLGALQDWVRRMGFQLK